MAPGRERRPAKRVWQKSEGKSDRSVRKSDQEVPQNETKKKGPTELLLPTSYPWKNYIQPPPSPTPFWPEGIFEGERGGGVYISNPHAVGIYTSPSFIPPPPLQGNFQGWGGVVYKIWPRILSCGNLIVGLSQKDMK